MAFYNKYSPDELLWMLLRAASGETVTELSAALNSLAKSEKALTDSFFSKVIDQQAFNTPDYQRFRNFLVEWNAAHKTITATAARMSDPRVITNDDLDELFRSFGFNYSNVLQGPTSDPLTQKINFFLDLVNLYKRKGTPQAIYEVLQYFGVTNLDIFEFFLKFNKANSLVFHGDAITGTTVDPAPIKYPFNSFTETDPHWLLTEEQIRRLHSSIKINLPSKTNYLGVRPNARADGPEFSIYSNIVQDQYYAYRFTNTPPPNNAEISIIGEVHSLLELHLATLYIFNKMYPTSGIGGDQFTCYDGSNLITDITAILAEFNSINRRPDFTWEAGPRIHREILLREYYDKFCRLTPRNFLQTKSNVITILNQIDPTIIPSLNNLTESLSEIFFILVKDISNWIRNNVGYGFINFGFIIFGLDSFFSDLKPVINFFKPYRARLLFLEALQIKSQLFESINIEEEWEMYIEEEVIDRLVGDSHPCCVVNREIITPDEMCFDSEETYHSREYFDCGSWFDIGAVTDNNRQVFIEYTEEVPDTVKCRYASDAVMTHNMIVSGSDPTLFMPHNDNEEGDATQGEISTTLQTSGLADFDYSGCFDNVNGFEVLYIEIEQVS
jgi:hypothetical protein